MRKQNKKVGKKPQPQRVITFLFTFFAKNELIFPQPCLTFNEMKSE
jgi:hypothetical protein